RPCRPGAVPPRARVLPARGASCALLGVIMDTVVLVGAVALGAFILGWGIERIRLRRAQADAESVAARIRAQAEQESEHIRRAAELAGKEAAFRAKEEWEREEA